MGGRRPRGSGDFNLALCKKKGEKKPAGSESSGEYQGIKNFGVEAEKRNEIMKPSKYGRNGESLAKGTLEDNRKRLGKQWSRGNVPAYTRGSRRSKKLGRGGLPLWGCKKQAVKEVLL